MTLSKEERYAMIRRAAIKVQQRQQSQRRTSQLQRKKFEKAMDVLDDQSNMHWEDTDRYLDAHYGEVFEGDANDGNRYDS
jgi:hypothetical protein